MSSKSDDDSKGWLVQPDPMSDLALTIRTLREGLGLSPDELAQKVGVTRSAVSAWETNANGVGRKRLKKLADALGVTVTELLTGKVKTPQKTAGTLVAIESDGDEIPIYEIKSAVPKIWTKSRQRILLIEDQQGRKIGLLATDQSIQALESCLLILRELL
jgi:transcriptional regulator with XRE-family HTH domain